MEQLVIAPHSTRYGFVKKSALDDESEIKFEVAE